MSDSMLSEDIVWKKFLSGDATSFDTLVKNAYPILFQYGAKFCRDQEIIKDCIQDVFLKIWENRKSLNSSIPVRPYLLASLRRRINRKITYDHLEFSLDIVDESFCTEFTIEEEMMEMEESKEIISKITELLNHLPPRQKEIIYLKFFQDLNREEIAEVMQLSPQSVSNLFQKSLYRLRKEFSSSTLLYYLTILSFFLK